MFRYPIIIKNCFIIMDKVSVYYFRSVKFSMPFSMLTSALLRGLQKMTASKPIS